MRVLGAFGVSIGIHFASVELSIFGSFCRCVFETAHDELISTVAATAGARLGRGIPYPGHRWSGKE